MHTRLLLLCLSLTLCGGCLGRDRVPALPQFKPMAGSVQSQAHKSGTPAAELSKPESSRCATCAHILVLRMRPNIDPKMVLKFRGHSEFKMPIVKGTPVCPQDIR
jgi:hypothetical protein